MNSLYWSSCLWLCFLCTGVESLSKFHIRPRDQYGEVTLTINYIVDDFADTNNKQTVEWWLQQVTRQTEIYFHSFFRFSLHLESTTTYLVNQSELISKLKPYKRQPFLSLDEAIEALTNYFEDKNHADIICFVTNLTLHDGDNVIKGHGYSTQKTLCESGVSILLAYAPDQPGWLAHKLVRIIMDSISSDVDQHALNIPVDQLTKVNEYLRKCKNGREDLPTPSQPDEEPPTPRPPEPPSEPENPTPTEKPPTTPEEPPAPMPPQPEPQPPPEPPVTTTTTTVTPVPDYC